MKVMEKSNADEIVRVENELEKTIETPWPSDTKSEQLLISCKNFAMLILT